LALLQELNAAGWLTTDQIRRRLFCGRTANAVSKRLRRLAGARYIAMARTSSTEAGLYRLAGQGKLALVECSGLSDQDISIPNQIPRKLRHFAAINDLRFCFEQIGTEGSFTLLFFFSERELAAHFQQAVTDPSDILFCLSRHGILPDALAKIRILGGQREQELNLAIEYDAGTEQASFFGRTKVKHYGALVLDSRVRVGDLRVLIFADRVSRLVSLMSQVVRHRAPRHVFYFAPLASIEQENWEGAEVFLDPYDFFVLTTQSGKTEVSECEFPDKPPRYSLLTLPARSPRNPSPREESPG